MQQFAVTLVVTVVMLAAVLGRARHVEEAKQWCADSSDLGPCPPARRGSACHCVFTKDFSKARCCHVDLRRIGDEVSTCENATIRHNLNALFLSNCTADNDELNLAGMTQLFPHLKTLSLTQGGYDILKKEDSNSYPIFPKLKCLNLSNNALREREGISQAVNAMQQLKVVDLANNRLDFTPELNNRSTTLWMHLAGNLGLKCDGLREHLQKAVPTKFLNNGNTYCTSQSSFDWFNSTDPISLLQIEAREKMKKECPEPCTCISNRLVYEKNKRPYYAVTVDCSGRQLTELPARLPDLTMTLNISNNSIINLDPLISKNNNYENIKILDASFNYIESIQVLEGSDFLQKFEVFSLSNNHLKSLTTHVLSNAFEKNFHSLHLYLGQNYFHCDCSTFHSLKAWLIKYKKHIADPEDIFCSDTGIPILHLQQESVCLAEEEWTQHIYYYIIVAEVLLLLLLVGKVSYDYWVFKNAGYLPWPASKMPKLPCDCVLET